MRRRIRHELTSELRAKLAPDLAALRTALEGIQKAGHEDLDAVHLEMGRLHKRMTDVLDRLEVLAARLAAPAPAAEPAPPAPETGSPVIKQARTRKPAAAKGDGTA